MLMVLACAEFPVAALLAIAALTFCFEPMAASRAVMLMVFPWMEVSVTRLLPAAALTVWSPRSTRRTCWAGEGQRGVGWRRRGGG
ncbi:hypothetical protein BC829DRAFT_407892, partial [Chytridium lagenaria]